MNSNIENIKWKAEQLVALAKQVGVVLTVDMKRLRDTNPHAAQTALAQEQGETNSGVTDEDDVGNLEYRGNSVGYIFQKMTAYKKGIDDVWNALKSIGVHPDGKTSVSDAIRNLYTHPQPKQAQSEPVAKVRHDLDGHIGWNPNLTELPDEGVELYTTPQQRKPLTGDATTFVQRFTDAVAILCGSEPPGDLVIEWLDNVEVDSVHRLQEWVLNQDATPAWAQGIGVLDAAHLLASTPVEGEQHEDEATHRTKKQDLEDPYTSKEESHALIKKDTRTDFEKNQDALIDKQWGNEQGAEPAKRAWVGLDWLPKHKCGLHLIHNEHRDVYETVEQFYDVECFVSIEEWHKAVAEDSVWVLHWYPETPIGFHRIAASTLEAIEAKIKEETDDTR